MSYIVGGRQKCKPQRHRHQTSRPPRGRVQRLHVAPSIEIRADGRLTVAEPSVELKRTHHEQTLAEHRLPSEQEPWLDVVVDGQHASPFRPQGRHVVPPQYAPDSQ